MFGMVQTRHIDWDRRWLRIAREVSTWSKDPKKKIGAVAVRDKREVAKGYNGFPSRIDDKEDWLNDDEMRRRLTVHAEVNMINNAMRFGQTIEGTRVYLYGLAPCQNCAINLINAGVLRIDFCRTYVDPKWDADWELSSELFRRAGIIATSHDPESI